MLAVAHATLWVTQAFDGPTEASAQSLQDRREGAQLTRARRLSRWLDGSSWVWTAFRKQVGRGEGSSGLRFDQLDGQGGA